MLKKEREYFRRDFFIEKVNKIISEEIKTKSGIEIFEAGKKRNKRLWKKTERQRKLLEGKTWKRERK